MKNKTMVIGCGRLGASIANHASAIGEQTIVLDGNAAAFERLSDAFTGYKLIVDATDETELIEAGIKDAREVVITTGNDNINLFLAHLCYKKFLIPEIYVRFDDPDMGILLSGMDVKIIYPFQLTRDRFNALKQGGEK